MISGTPTRTYSTGYQVLKLLQERGTQTVENVCSAMAGVSEGTTRNAITQLGKAGLVQRVYGVTEHGRDWVSSCVRTKKTYTTRFILMNHLDEEGTATLDTLHRVLYTYLNRERVSALIHRLSAEQHINTNLVELTELGAQYIKDGKATLE